MHYEIGHYLSAKDCFHLRLVNWQCNSISNKFLTKRNLTFTIKGPQDLEAFNAIFNNDVVTFRPTGFDFQKSFIKKISDVNNAATLAVFAEITRRNIRILNFHFPKNNELREEEYISIQKFILSLLEKSKNTIEELRFTAFPELDAASLDNDIVFPVLKTLVINYESDHEISTDGDIFIENSLAQRLSKACRSLCNVKLVSDNNDLYENLIDMAHMIENIVQNNPFAKFQLGINAEGVPDDWVNVIEKLKNLPLQIVSLKLTIAKDATEGMKTLVEWLESQCQTLEVLELIGTEWQAPIQPLVFPTFPVLKKLTYFHHASQTILPIHLATALPNVHDLASSFHLTDFTVPLPSVTKITLHNRSEGNVLPNVNITKTLGNRFLATFPNVQKLLQCRSTFLAHDFLYQFQELTTLSIIPWYSALETDKKYWEYLTRGAPKVTYDEILTLGQQGNQNISDDSKLSFSSLKKLKEIRIRTPAPGTATVEALLYLSVIGKLKKMERISITFLVKQSYTGGLPLLQIGSLKMLHKSVDYDQCPSK